MIIINLQLAQYVDCVMSLIVTSPHYERMYSLAVEHSIYYGGHELEIAISLVNNRWKSNATQRGVQCAA